MTAKRCLGFLSILVVVAVGCESPTTTNVQPVIRGDVDLYDELGTRLPSADQVRVEALTPSSLGKYEAFTDATGHFELELPDTEAVPLPFSRDGFGDMFRFDVKDGTESIHIRLCARSSAEVTSVAAMAEPCGTTVNCIRLAMEVGNFFGPGTTRRLFRMYLSTDPGVSAHDYDLMGLLVVPNNQPGLLQEGPDAEFESDYLHGFLGSLPTGNTVHLVIHGATENLASSYMEPNTGLEIFTDLSQVSAEASFIVP
jgi:hypothetical protein